MKLVCLLVFTFLYSHLQAEPYRKAVSGDVVVLPKLFPKKKKLELSALNVGVLMNQSYVDTVVLNGGVGYHLREDLGFNVEASLFLNSDRAERTCIESFYNDPDRILGSVCGGASGLQDQNGGDLDGVNFGPAYVAVRELQSVLLANVIYSPIYSKQLAFGDSVAYFDLFFVAGLGLANSLFYPETLTLKNGLPSRKRVLTEAEKNKEGCPDTYGVCADDAASVVGVLGRPEALAESHPAMNFGMGQKFHVTKNFYVDAEMRMLMLLGTSTGIEPFFSLWVGSGFRF
ncbi:MAG: outer membrane beta-barrel domain-containing protein [Oligoflexales bacterium]